MNMSRIVVGILASTVALHAQGDRYAGVQHAVSIAEIQKTLDAFNIDRTSGKEGERQASDYLVRKLTEYGIKQTRYEARLYMSWPIAAELTVPGNPSFTVRGVTPAFGATTPQGGLTAEVVLRIGPNQPFGSDVRGKIVVASGGVSPDRALAAQRAGVAGLIMVSDDEITHEMIATTIWGSPTTESASRLPSIPIIHIKKSEGERLRAAAAPPGLKVHLTTKVEQRWATAPLVVADVPGKSADFVLIATHIDAWYKGMTDTAGSDASILEMARVLQAQRGSLERGVRFAWWPGHSFGRYAGSTWYVDRFWMDLDQHCVAYTNLDGPGRRGSPMDRVSAAGWPGIEEFSREFAQKLTGKAPEASAVRGGGVFRPTRDSDSSFQGLGIPEFSIGVPGPPRTHPDIEANGQISYWHTAQDTLDKIDPKVLELDTQYRVAQLYALATTPDLPLKIAPIATSFGKVLDELATAGGATVDLKTTREAAAALHRAADRLDAAPRPADPTKRAARNDFLVRLTHELNARLYTKAGRVDQDPAANVPVLPLLDRVRELPKLDKNSDAYGFLETELLRGRSAVESTLRDATRQIDAYLAMTPAAVRSSSDR
jgi:N-acetylated-alpha-linked acidic dipeptidase